jgi:hypothetical protein
MGQRHSGVTRIMAVMLGSGRWPLARPVWVSWPITAGFALGIASFYADLVDGTARAALQFLASTGFAWGCAAFVVAFPARTRGAAVAAAVTLLCTATVCYYGLNLTGDRWRSYGLVPVLLALTYWLLMSVAGGAVLGVLAHVVRTDRAPLAAAAAGLACGLLAGAGLALVGTLLAVGDHGRTRLAEGFLQAVAGVSITAWMFGRRRGPRPWARFAATAVAACTAGALTWYAVESVQVIGF